MPSGTSKVQIFNAAIDLVEDEAITSPTDDTAPAKWLNRNYDLVRDYLIRGYEFNFARDRACIAAQSTEPAFGWKYQYTIPVDCLRVLPLTEGGLLNGKLIPYEIENTVILTNAKPPLKLRYLRRVENPTEFDAMFVQLLAARLGMMMAQAITGKASFQQILSQFYTDIQEKAEVVDAQEGTPTDPVQDEYLDARIEV